MIKILNNYTSPNFGERPSGIKIDTIVIHYTDMKDARSALNRLCDKAAEVSSHYLIDKQGNIFSLVPDHLRAWHAGLSCWRGREKVNDYSIGIELDNNGKEEFSESLMGSLINLCHFLIKRHPIEHRNIIGHSDIIPPRKFDPGRLFDWKLLAKNGIGIFPEISSFDYISSIRPLSKESEFGNLSILEIQQKLLKYGYKIEVNGLLDQQTKEVMRAFNEHFNPDCYQDWDEKSQAILFALMKEI